MESNRRRRSTRRRREQEEMVRKVIWPSIRGHTCPICFTNLQHHYKQAAILSLCFHAYCIDCIRKWSVFKRNCPLCNSNFTSWFCNLSLSSREFRKEVLPFEGFPRNSHQEISSSRLYAPRFRLLRRTRVALDERRNKALPWRRSFGRPGHASPEVIAQRKLDWRASIYKKQLKAVPLTSSILEQINPRNNFLREKTLQKIEPWIRRELQAVLGDPDPTIIVHVATSQYFAWLKEKVSSGQSDVEETFIKPLRPFLQDKAMIFWHELRAPGAMLRVVTILKHMMLWLNIKGRSERRENTCTTTTHINVGGWKLWWHILSELIPMPIQDSACILTQPIPAFQDAFHWHLAWHSSQTEI